MRLEWIEDILAVLKAGSLNRAAEQRYLTQPAFSRRIRSIEQYLGVEVIDRTRKPAQLRPVILDEQDRLEHLAVELRDLLNHLRQQDRKGDNRIVIAGQHSITTSVAPSVIKQLSANLETNVRLRSANRDECFAMLLTKQADVTVIFRLEDEEFPLQGSLIEQCDFDSEDLVPVVASAALETLNERYRRGELPVVTYPGDVFLGEVLSRKIFPKLRRQTFLRIRAETALTLAALRLAEEGVGVAWVPLSLSAGQIANGTLTDLSHLLQRIPLKISAFRLSGQKSTAEQDAWNVITALAEAQTQ